jgi:hypothetical protein
VRRTHDATQDFLCRTCVIGRALRGVRSKESGWYSAIRSGWIYRALVSQVTSRLPRTCKATCHQTSKHVGFGSWEAKLIPSTIIPPNFKLTLNPIKRPARTHSPKRLCSTITSTKSPSRRACARSVLSLGLDLAIHHEEQSRRSYEDMI